MAVKLDQHEEQILESASRDAITGALARLSIREQPLRWLPERHKYIEPYLAPVLNQSQKIDGPALAERIAVSIPNHVFDGWSYLGRAIHCLIRGDTRNAVHLGYYAELRSALAVLASEGIGLLDRNHFVIQSDGSAKRICGKTGIPRTSGTHQMIWPIYSWWIKQSRSGDLVADVIRPGHRPLKDWFSSPILRQPYLQRNTEQWLKVWGFDLERMNLDRGARNAASYGPSGLHGWQVMEEAEAIKMVLLMWQMFEPQHASRFENVDRWFLREVLLTAFKGITNSQWRSKNWDADFKRFIGSFLQGQPEDQSTKSECVYWQEFLDKSGNEQKPLPFRLAGKESHLSDESFPFELLSRAAFHLRFATGSCALLLNKADVDWGSLSFWLNDVGVRRRFWIRDAYPEDPIELWTDLEEAIEALNGSTTNGTLSVQDIHTLEECERICFWGMAESSLGV